jgi:hypothetical protein
MLRSMAGLSLPPRALLITGAAMSALVLLLNVPGNPVLELRDHQTAGMVFAHAAVVVLALGLWPVLSGALAAALEIDDRSLSSRLAAVVGSVAGAMVLVAAAWPEYSRQILTREWGAVEPVQFVLYLMTARLCFVMADHWPPRTPSRRLYLMGGWLGRFFALEEVDYLGVLAPLVQLAGVERSRISGSYVGAVHDTLNVAAHHGLAWLALLMLVAAAAVAVSWISGGRVARAWQIVSWRVIPAAVGVGFMAVAQFEDIDGQEIVGPHGRLLNILLEEPCELLAILCLNFTLVLELAHHSRQRGA